MAAMTDFDGAAEGATLAAMIQDEALRAEVLCEPLDLFGAPQHLFLRRAIGHLTERGEAVDALTVAREAHELGLGRAEEIVKALPTASGKYLAMLARARLRRKAEEIGHMLLAGKEPVKDLEDATELAAAALAGSGKPLVGAGDAGDAALRQARSGAPKVLRTGLRDLNETLQLLGPGDFVVLGARPSVGKTALAVQIARQTAASGRGVLLCSLEMAPEAISLRLVAQEAQVPFTVMAANALDAEGWRRAGKGLEKIRRLPLVIADASGSTSTQIRAAGIKAKAAFERGGKRLGLLVVDYLQIVAPGKPERSREREIAQVSSALKATAQALGVVVLGLSQLNRSLESRQDKRPTLSDLRESGAIEQDADAVLLLHRGQKQSGVAEVFVAKQRNGPTGAVRAVWHGPTMAFGEIGDAYEDPWGDEAVLK